MKKKSWRTDAFDLWCCRRLLRVPWTARRANQSILKEISPQYSFNIHWKDWCWSWNSNTLAIWCEELTPWKKPWCWERLKAGGEGDNRGWDGWMVSLTLWTWIWASSACWWWTGKPGVLQSMESQRVGHHWVTELNWTEETKAWFAGNEVEGNSFGSSSDRFNLTLLFWVLQNPLDHKNFSFSPSFFIPPSPKQQEVESHWAWWNGVVFVQGVTPAPKFRWYSGRSDR